MGVVGKEQPTIAKIARRQAVTQIYAFCLTAGYRIFGAAIAGGQSADSDEFDPDWEAIPMNTLSLLNMSHIVFDGLYESIPILLSFAVFSLGAAEQDAGMILSLAAVLSTLLGLSAAFWSQHCGVFRTIGLIALFYGIGFLLSAFSFHLYIMGLCFILASAGQNVFHNISFAHLSAHTDSSLRGKVMGNFTAIGDIGRIPFASLAGCIAAYPLAGQPGWRSACFFYGLGTLCFAGYLFFAAGRAKIEGLTPAIQTKQAFGLPSLALLRNREYRLAVQANIFDAIGSDHIFTFLPYLLLAKGLDLKSIGGFAFAFTLGCFLGKLACGHMIDRFGTRRVFIYSESAMGVLLVVLILSHGLPAVVLASLLLGIVTKGTVPAMQTILAQPFAGRASYDDVYALSGFFRGTIHIAAPLLFGSVAAAYGIDWIYRLMAGAAIFAVLPIALMKDSAEVAAWRKTEVK